MVQSGNRFVFVSVTIVRAFSSSIPFIVSLLSQSKDKKTDESIVIDGDTDEEVISEYRNGAEFSVTWGLIFPPSYVILTKSDEAVNSAWGTGQKVLVL